MNGAESIAAERKRQTEVEGYGIDHDDQNINSEFVLAALNYAAAVIYRRRGIDPAEQRSEGGIFTGWWKWPFGFWWWKPKDDRADLVRAGALIAAEIDRMDREEFFK